jgi:hypothetical protein
VLAEELERSRRLTFTGAGGRDLHACAGDGPGVARVEEGDGDIDHVAIA